ncbi:hypothetical protein ACLOJK_019657 [Asimina triloba]
MASPAQIVASQAIPTRSNDCSSSSFRGENLVNLQQNAPRQTQSEQRSSCSLDRLFDFSPVPSPDPTPPAGEHPSRRPCHQRLQQAATAHLNQSWQKLNKKPNWQNWQRPLRPSSKQRWANLRTIAGSKQSSSGLPKSAVDGLKFTIILPQKSREQLVQDAHDCNLSRQLESQKSISSPIRKQCRIQCCVQVIVRKSNMDAILFAQPDNLRKFKWKSSP